MTKRKLFNTFIEGEARPKGSVSAFRNRVVHPASTKKWQKKIETHFQNEYKKRRLDKRTTVEVRCVFYFRKTKSKKAVDKGPYVTKPPDLDKLIRTVLDAMTDIVYDDDAQVVRLSGEKRYAINNDPIGVDITIWRFPNE